MTDVAKKIACKEITTMDNQIIENFSIMSSAVSCWKEYILKKDTDRNVEYLCVS